MYIRWHKGNGEHHQFDSASWAMCTNTWFIFQGARTSCKGGKWSQRGGTCEWTLRWINHPHADALLLSSSPLFTFPRFFPPALPYPASHHLSRCSPLLLPLKLSSVISFPYLPSSLPSIYVHAHIVSPSLSLSPSLSPDGWQRVAACCGQANYLHNYDLPLNHMILYLDVGN